MVCYHPLDAYRSKEDRPKRKIYFGHPSPYANNVEILHIPCGRCIGCRLERSRQWAVRISHEASLHEANSFITLTYNDKNLPPGGSLVKRDFQLFMKRLRKKHQDTKIRYFQCGEYGEKFARPHYHACLFGLDFPDQEQFQFNKETKTWLYTSPTLEEVWPLGFSTIGKVTFESAAYCARYITKKINGPMADDHYKGRLPEYTTMSRGGKGGHGIGYDWLIKHQFEPYPDDNCLMSTAKGNRPGKPPRYYDNQYEIHDPDGFELLKQKRLEQQAKNASNNTPERLAIRKKILIQRIKPLQRKYEATE